MQRRTFMMFIGTRPEIIKMAPVFKALTQQGEQVCVVHSGQHDSMAQGLYDFFGMPPDVSIDLHRKSPSLAHLTTSLLDAMEDVLNTHRADAVVVQGDTSTAMVGALVAYYHDLPVAHVEAGLRTWQREPFPEEKNRELIGRLAYWHFPPTPQARRNLLQEHIPAQHIYEVGNTVIDAALMARDRLAGDSAADPALHAPDLGSFLDAMQDRKLLLVTAHRRENWGQPIRRIAQAVSELLRQHPEVVAVWPVHPNPAVRKDIRSALEAIDEDVRARLCLTEPADYPSLIDLLSRCVFTLTDSGGIQEEASAFAKPVLVARESTERQELVDAGGAVLVGTDIASIVAHAHAHALLTDATLYQSMQLDSSPFGDGHSGQRIANILGSDEGAMPQNPS
ncbi:MAG TPA: UDP-N-acetylglucosamine 2-epimerase (non-hydrolyzing) [Noviherbaspirillum sp.]|uniref:non-hydrolyzing UDP-N-acetylglucosamine 2-epimerase n=1 Tax=Noviherbaspirillum sp. TaxID=1926288 RepID=UPI002B45C511|nr:UDP-N-acetylglucosamine 2-epimerase (non-hydrolyzing) [Noviherbaspirillum sp.]HJV88435.1 UDP-N-acetylglucosamine 2-epimerase (non-hydrolyzing) [Noviherbaspirillum sp.]